MKEYILELCQRAFIILFIFITALSLCLVIVNIIKKRKKLFKHKKKEEPQLAEGPMILKLSTIKPTKCEFCRCVYKARPTDLQNTHVWQARPGVECPICGTINLIYFEEDENETSL